MNTLQQIIGAIATALATSLLSMGQAASHLNAKRFHGRRSRCRLPARCLGSDRISYRLHNPIISENGKLIIVTTIQNHYHF